MERHMRRRRRDLYREHYPLALPAFAGAGVFCLLALLIALKAVTA